MTRKVSKKKIEAVARELHVFLDYGILSTYYAITKATDNSLDEDERGRQLEVLDKLLTNSECLYEDLSDKQKELMEGLALELINKIRK